MMNDLISVIVPVYKVELYLDRCIKSVVEQTYGNLEVILVDDGSPDHCPQICDEWAKQDKRIKVIHKQNGGLSDARNVGIAAACGKYLTFVDSDDYIDQCYIYCLYTQIQKTGAQISCVDMLRFSDREQVVPDAEEYEIEIYGREKAIAALFDKAKFQNFVCNKMFDRKLFDSVKFPLGRVMEDLAVVYKLIEQCELVSYCPRKLYFYYQRVGSILHANKSRYMMDWYSLSKERYLYIREEYPDMKENYQNFNSVILESYPFLEKEEMIYAWREFMKNRVYGLNKPTWKGKVMCILFVLNREIYCAARSWLEKNAC